MPLQEGTSKDKWWLSSLTCVMPPTHFWGCSQTMKTGAYRIQLHLGTIYSYLLAGWVSFFGLFLYIAWCGDQQCGVCWERLFFRFVHGLSVKYTGYWTTRPLVGLYFKVKGSLDDKKWSRLVKSYSLRAHMVGWYHGYNWKAKKAVETWTFLL
jgi:hypothetical protein